MRHYTFFMLLALGLSGTSLTALAQQASIESEKLVDEGLELYKNDKNGEALERFGQALKLAPNDWRAQYGTSLVYYTTGRYAEAAALCELLVKRGDDKLPNLYVTYGTSLDRQQKSAEAVQVYQQAIQKYPTDEPLRRYQGIALQSLARYDEAAISFQQAIRLRPDYPITHLLLTQVEAARNNRVPALLACVRNLMIETVPRRASKSVGSLDRLMQHGVKQTGEKKVSLNLSAATMEQANSKEKKTDDFARVDVLLTMETALDYDDKNKNTAPAERFAEKFGALCRGLDEQKPAQRLGFNWQFYAPFFIEMEKKGHVQALAYTIQAMRAEVSPDVAVWLQQHSGQVAAMVGWAKAYQWPQ